MDSNESTSPTPAPTDLSIPAEAKSYFRKMAKWCRLTGIGGILAVSLLIFSIFGFFWGIQISSGSNWSKEARIVFSLLLFLFGDVFLLTIFILRFSNGMFRAAHSGQPRDVRNALERLLTYLRVAGILSVLLLFGLLLLVTAVLTY